MITTISTIRIYSDHRYLSLLLSICCCIGFIGCAYSGRTGTMYAEQTEEKHSVDPMTSQEQPVSPATMNERVERVANEYKDYAPIPRLALFDIAYPKDPDEYKKMDGYAVLLIVAVVQDSSELPLKRVYTRLKEKEIPLTLISSVFSKVDTESQIAKVFGLNRWEGLYLFPAYLRIDAEELLIDFATHRENFILSRFSEEDHSESNNLPIAKPKSTEPSKEALLYFKRLKTKLF